MSQALGSETLRSQAGRVLRAQIIAGLLAPGELYTISAISEELEVSATPVREAVSQLAAEGLVTLARNRGFRVRVITDHDLDEILQLRTMLEPAAVAEIAQRGLLVDEQSLRALAREISAHAASGDLVRFLEVDRRFHLGVLACLGNERLLQVVGQLRDHTRLYGLRKVEGTGAFQASADEHERLLDLVAQHKADDARALMIAHLRHARGIWAGRSE
ncbi:GntR family transcriptional regulator [Pseudonocardia acaciae]|uniref:GntR family transcriptional regulator n=1 Tax=Pseudonocardia acaciae TaxID=551276 RepID=UPI00048F9BCB|nr:GntR family transcriptional regulator [Pseudonocardia acaciae]